MPGRWHTCRCDGAQRVSDESMATADASRAGETRRPPAYATPLIIRRLAAFVIDASVVAVFSLTTAKRDEFKTVAFFILYHTVSLGLVGGTLGKFALGLRVQRDDGAKLKWTQALLRSTFGYLASLFLGLGFLHALRDPKSRARSIEHGQRTVTVKVSPSA